MRTIRNYLHKREKAAAEKNHERMVIKANLFGQIRIPVEFRYVGDNEASTNMVVAPCGHVFSESVVNHLSLCPDHRKQKWEDQNFKTDVSKPLSKVVAEFKKLHQDILSKINGLKSRKQHNIDPITEQVRVFNSRAATLARRLNEYKSYLKDRAHMKLQVLQAYDDIPLNFQCLISLDLAEDPVLTSCCANIFSKSNLAPLISYNGSGSCPTCRANFTKADLECLPPERIKSGMELKSPTSLSDEKITLQHKVKSLFTYYNQEREKLSLVELTDEKLVQTKISAFKELVKTLVIKLNDYQVEMRLIPLRDKLTQQCKQIPAEIGDLINIQQPLLGEDGICHAKSLHNQNDPSYIENPLLLAFRDLYRQEHSALTNRIGLMKVEDADAIRGAITTFKQEKAAQFALVKRTIYFQTIVHHLQLDLNNLEHLRYWNLQNNACWHGYGGVQVIHPSGEVYRIPTRIHKMMDIVNRNADYPTHEAFIAALNNARSKRPSFWNNPLSWVTRSAATERLYSTADNEIQRFRRQQL